MRQRALIAATAVCLCALGWADSAKHRETRSEIRDFAPGGRLELHLRGGDVHIAPGDDQHIRLRYTTESSSADFAGKVKTELAMSGQTMKLDVKAPHGGSVNLEVEVPAHTDLYIRMLGGDLEVGPVKGNQDLQTHFGDIRVTLPPRTEYGTVDASTHAGDVNAPEGRPHGFIGSSVTFQGKGKYHIHTHTGAGDILFDTSDEPGQGLTY